MKTTYLWFGTAAVAVVAGAWFARSAWRAHHDLVTLHVRNAPLAEVIRQLERQTREKIDVDKKLDGLITLDLKDKPLAAVLDRVAEQSGASWRTVYAVYDSAPALRDLESALYGDKQLAEVGWQTIAPGALKEGALDAAHLAALPGGNGMVINKDGGPGAVQAGGSGPVRVIVRRGGPPGSESAASSDEQVLAGSGAGQIPPGTLVTATEDTAMEALGTNQSGGGAMRMRRQQRPAVVRVVRRRADGGSSSVEEEIWSPVEIVLESRLGSRLSDFSGAPTAEAAAQAAKQVKGRVKTYYAMRKSLLGMGLAGMSFNLRNSAVGQPGKSGEGTKQAGTNLAQLVGNTGPRPEDLEAVMQHRRAEELGKLTPEQRVQRARERQGLNQN